MPMLAGDTIVFLIFTMRIKMPPNDRRHFLFHHLQYGIEDLNSISALTLFDYNTETGVVNTMPALETKTEGRGRPEGSVVP